jgi:hypothetical protein
MSQESSLFMCVYIGGVYKIAHCVKEKERDCVYVWAEDYWCSVAREDEKREEN